VLGLGASVIPLAAYQFIAHLAVVTSLVQVEPGHIAAVQQSQKLDKITKDLEIARGQAALFAWLGHSWPRSQILAKIHEPLPDSMRLTDVKLTVETKTPTGVAATGRSRAQRRGAEPAETPPEDGKQAERDWRKLAERVQEQEEVVTLAGVSVDTTAPHTYVAKLRQSGLFAKSELKSLESVAGENAKTQKFEIRLVLAPGHGKSESKAKPAQQAQSTVASR
jgi:Tfp pilus assembly protein PilN